MRHVTEAVIGASLFAVVFTGCTSGSSTTSSEGSFAPSFTQADLAAARSEGFDKGYSQGYAKGYRLGQAYVCNTLYGTSAATGDGWHFDSADPNNGPLHKATVLVWFANSPSEVPYAITKTMCLQPSKT